MANQPVPFIKSSSTENRLLIVAEVLQKILIQHWYYRDNRCTDIVLIPTDSTQAILKRYALKIKSVGNEHQIISLREFDNSDLVNEMQQEKLKFYLKSKNPYFTNFTALLEKQHPRGYYYFRKENQGIVQQEVVMVTNSFEWTFPTGQSISQFTLYDTDNNLLQTIDLVNEEGFSHVSIDMNLHPLGMYSLLSDDQTISLFLFKTATPPISSLLGLLELNLNGDVENPTIERWQLYPKKIRWQYNLYKSVSYQNYDDQLEDISSIEDEQSLEWDATQNVEVLEENGRTTLISTTQANWGDSGTYSSQVIALEQDAFMSATVVYDDVAPDQAIGFSTQMVMEYHYTSMHIGLLFKTDGILAIVEEGIERASMTTYQKNDTFCIVKVGCTTYCEKNGTVIARFDTAIQEDLKPLIAFKSNNAGFSDVYFHNFSSELPKIHFNRNDLLEKITYQSDRWLPYKQQPGKILELTLTDPQDPSEILSIPLRNPSALELETQIDLSV